MRITRRRGVAQAGAGGPRAALRVPGRDGRPLGRLGAGGDLHPRRELPGRSIGSDRGPDVVRGGGQVDLADDLEFTAHESGSLLFVMVGCSATTNRCVRPRGAPSSWYFATRPLTASANSTANAARSFADANRTSLSIPRVASGLPAALAPVMSSPTSRTRRPATASSQRAERWSGSRDGSGATADRAVGEITYDAAVAWSTRSVQLPLRPSSRSPTKPWRSSARRW